MTETLQDLDEELELILVHLDSENAEERTVAEQIFNDFSHRLEEKIDSYIKVIRTRESLTQFQQEEAKRIEALAKSNFNTVRWLKSKLLAFRERRVEALGEKGKKLEGKLSKVALCSNGGKPPVWIDPDLQEKDFPEPFLEYVPRLNRQALIETTLIEGELKNADGRLIAKVMPKRSHLRIQ